MFFSKKNDSSILNPIRVLFVLTRNMEGYGPKYSVAFLSGIQGLIRSNWDRD
jgi:hypothetical protein